MKKILLAFAVFALSLTGAKAQSSGPFIVSLLNQLQIPYTVVNNFSFDVSGAPNGRGAIRNDTQYGSTDLIFRAYSSGTLRSFEILYGYEYERARPPSATDWYYVPVFPGSQSYAYSANTGKLIILKVKANGNLKPVQISYDYSELVFFDADGYYYHVYLDPGYDSEYNDDLLGLHYFYYNN